MSKLVLGRARSPRQLPDHEPNGHCLAGAGLRRDAQVTSAERRVQHGLLDLGQFSEAFFSNRGRERGAEQFGEIIRSHIAAARSTSRRAWRPSLTETGKVAEF